MTRDGGPSAFDESYRAPDGRRASIAWQDGVLSVDIEWEGGAEQWRSPVGADQVGRTREGYHRTLAAAGFRPFVEGARGDPHTRLTPDAALAVAQALRPTRPALCRVIEVGVTMRNDRLRETCREARAERVSVGELFSDHENDGVVALHGGRHLWAWDDDGQLGSLPDPLPEGLAAALRRRRPDNLHVQVFGRVERWMAEYSGSQGPFSPSHLVLSGTAALPDEAPSGLLALTASPRTLGPWLRGDMSRLTDVEALTVLGMPGSWDELAALPSLTHLGVWHAGAQLEGMFHDVPAELIARLRTLDLFGVEGARNFPFERLLDERSRFEHLDQILLGGHLVSPETRSRFADWPQVLFVSHDRIEALAHDLRFIGFPSAHR